MLEPGQLFPEGETHANEEVIGTLGFIAPECMTAGYCKEKSNVHSFGTLLLELLTGKSINHSSCFEDGESYVLQDLVKKHAEKNKLNDILDPVIAEVGLWLEEQIFLICAELTLKCLYRSEDWLTMVQVAKQLRQIYQSRENLQL